MNEKKEKLCFVLPEYAQATHFSYVAEFVEALTDEFDVFLITEKGTLPENSNVTRRHGGRMHFAPLRVIEMCTMLLCARMLGYRTHYVHYSYIAAIASGIITRICGGRTLYWNCGMPWLYVRPKFQEWYERLAYHCVHFLVTGSSALVSGYAQYYAIPETKILIVPNWIDAQKSVSDLRVSEKENTRNALAISPSAKILLFVHRLAKRKGADLLPDILEKIDDTDTVLLVVGGGPEQESVIEKFKEKGLWNRVRMIGAVPQDAVLHYFEIADVFLLPSEEEGFPHVLTEAMAYGVPYVASDVGGVRNITPDILLPSVVPYRDVNQFSQCVNDLLSDDQKRKEIREVLLTWVTQYDKPVVLRQFVDMLRSVA